jgi:hypothetical protein
MRKIGVLRAGLLCWPASGDGAVLWPASADIFGLSKAKPAVVVRRAVGASTRIDLDNTKQSVRVDHYAVELTIRGGLSPGTQLGLSWFCRRCSEPFHYPDWSQQPVQGILFPGSIWYVGRERAAREGLQLR